MRAAVLAALLGVSLIATTGAARGETGDEERAPRPIPFGYAFDEPHILTQQLLWGLAHGARLLALDCQARGDGAAALAYVDWLDRQWPRIRAAEQDLARHYFGRDQAPAEAISAALSLKPYLETQSGELAAACATLPEALAAPRYDLERFHAEKCAELRCENEVSEKANARSALRRN
ncbi:MAG: hypothetical protein Q8O34_04610 [Rhodocyclaceae bacterium]|nr:hypothetical protein [Rhodocyclaceae bacterium]